MELVFSNCIDNSHDMISSEETIAFTDASRIPGTCSGGAYVILPKELGCGNYIRLMQKFAAVDDINIAETMMIRICLEYLNSLGCTNIVLYTDSQCCLSRLVMMQNDLPFYSNGKPVSELIQAEVRKLYRVIGNYCGELTIRKVEAHHTSAGNHYADHYAGLSRARNDTTLIAEHLDGQDDLPMTDANGGVKRRNRPHHAKAKRGYYQR
jgi:ribonuclease HI